MDDRLLALKMATRREANLRNSTAGTDLERASGYSENRLRQKFYGATGEPLTIMELSNLKQSNFGAAFMPNIHDEIRPSGPRQREALEKAATWTPRPRVSSGSLGAL